MKKYLILILVIGCLVFASKINAQSLPFERAYQDYQYNRTIYDQSYTDYQNTKNAYAVNPTLNLKDEAKQKALAMLRNRDQLTVVYLTALRANLSEQPGLEGPVRDNIYTKLDGEVAWYSNHKTNYKEEDSIEVLFTKNDEVKARYNSKTILIIDESLFDITLGQEKTLRQQHEQVYATLRGLIDQGVAAGKLTLNPFNHWLTDIDATIKTLKANEEKGLAQIQVIYTQTYSPDSDFDTAMQTLSQSVKPLSQFNQFLTEISAYIQNQQ